MKWFIAIFISFSASAQELWYLEQLEVVEGHIPNKKVAPSDAIITTEELNALQASSMDDVLKSTTAVTTQGGPRSTSEAPQIRGLDSSKLFLYIDGVKHNFRTDHSTMVPIDSSELKEVQVFKSNSSVEFSGGIGGGLVLKTKDPEDYLQRNQVNGATVKTGFDSVNNEKLINAKIYEKRKKTNLMFGFTNREAENTELGNGKELNNSSYNDLTAQMKVNTQLSANKKLTLAASYFQREDEAPINPTLNPPGTFTDLYSDNLGERQTYDVGFEAGSFETKVFVNDYKLNKKHKDSGDEELRQITTSGFNAKKISEIEKVSIQTGLDFNQDALKGQLANANLASYPGGTSNVFGAYTQLEFRPHRQWLMSPGVRLNSYELKPSDANMPTNQATALTKKLLNQFQVSKSTVIHANYTEGFNAPRIQYAYPDGLHHRGDGVIVADNYFIPNPNLEHETSQTYEAGFVMGFMDDSFKLSYNYYVGQMKDYIYLQKIDQMAGSGTNGTTQFINIPDADIEGSEISAQYLQNIWDVKVAYTTAKGYNETLGIYLSDMPANQYLFDVKMHQDKYGLTMGYLGIMTMAQNKVNPQTIERTTATPGYFIHSVFMNKKIMKDFNLSLRVDNMTNKDYRKHASFIPDAGRSIKLGLEYQITNF
ncbi:MAG: TonB-dependent receptor [Bacteriovoracaceae bacterium]|nr:TonB-dependent receptor [Bacteriovoracaceae bacterium]